MSQTTSTTVTVLFEEQAQNTPNNIAVSDGKYSLTYAELNQKANQVAHWLIEEGVDKNSYVAILLDSSINFFICMLAILKANAVYIPLDPQSPEFRINNIIADSTPKLVITNNYFIDKLTGIKAVAIGNLLNLCKTYDITNPIAKQVSIDPIYVIYTSGTTGNPKGVIIPHVAVVNVSKVINLTGVGVTSKVAQFANIAFDLSVDEIWSTLLNGATLFILPFMAKIDNSILSNYLIEHNINKLYLPTSFFHQVARISPQVLDSADTILICGEQSNPNIIIDFLAWRKAKLNPVKLINAYGPTECTVFSTAVTFNEQERYSFNDLSSIGSPIQNTTIYILDESLMPVSVGNVGEIYISGINIALGYHNSENLTKERFIENPYSDIPPYNKLYKTGDLAKMLPDGNLLCIGRVDDQVKIRGYRIHLREVENALLESEGVSAATVIVQSRGIYTQIQAYIIPQHSYNEITPEHVRNDLLNKLPEYMVPSKIFILNKFPLTINGKIDKKKLSEITPYRKIAKTTCESSFILTKLISVWEKLINQSPLDADKNLFEQGATSIMLLEAAALISHELGQPVDISILLQFPSISKLARHLEEKQVTIE